MAPSVENGPTHGGKEGRGETVNLRDTYLKRLGELVRFDVLRKGKSKFVVDALHGCGAGYLDRVGVVLGEMVRHTRDPRVHVRW